MIFVAIISAVVLAAWAYLYATWRKVVRARRETVRVIADTLGPDAAYDWLAAQPLTLGQAFLASRGLPWQGR